MGESDYRIHFKMTREEQSLYALFFLIFLDDMIA